MEYIAKACVIAGFLLLAGCQGTPQADKLAQRSPAGLPSTHHIDNVPFYPQQQYYCGPTTLSEVFGYYGKDIDASDIAPNIFIPDKQGSLQLEMVTATRHYDFLPYTERGTLTQLMSLISDGIPVIVFQNLSISLLPQWHYAVVKGYDLEKQTLSLHTGVTADHEMSFALFEKTWARGNYWLLAPVPPQKTSEHMTVFTYVSAAYDLLKVGKDEQAMAYLTAATQQWPSYWVSYFLIANHYSDKNKPKALGWFEKGYPHGKYEKAFLHNYALLLEETGKIDRANQVVRHALTVFPDDEALLKIGHRLSSITDPS